MKLSSIHKCNQQSKTVTKTSSGMDGSLFIHCTTKLTGVLTRLWWNDAVLNSLKPLPTSTTQKQSDFSRSYYTLQTAWVQTNAWQVSRLLLGASLLQKQTLSTTPHACASRLDKKKKKKKKKAPKKKAMMKWCLMSSDVRWHIRDKLRPMPKHGSINLYVHGSQKAR